MILSMAPETATQPGWGKLIALLIAVGIFWIGVQVHKRFARVKDGAEVNPFSDNANQAPETAKPQVATPSESPKTTTRKGLGKWLRKG